MIGYWKLSRVLALFGLLDEPGRARSAGPSPPGQPEAAAARVLVGTADAQPRTVGLDMVLATAR